jgi:hypothetical protein
MTGGHGLTLARRRLETLDGHAANQILETTARFLSSSGTKEDLIDAVMNSEAGASIGLTFDAQETEWQRTCDYLRSLK